MIQAIPIGHDPLQQRFARALQSGQMHHAWLLYGPEGIGKAMQARRMAAIYLCQQPRGIEACGGCHSCRMLAAGSHPDFKHVGCAEGKRDISVDQVRDMLAFLALSGGESSRRVVLLRDAEQLNLHAANAMLKGLEEPPYGSLMLIVANDIQRLPATVRSRCLLTPLKPLGTGDCRRVLEGLGLGAEAMALAMRLAAGQPGRVAAMAEATVAAALLEWQALTKDLAAADLGAVERWIDTHVMRLPPALVADVVLLPLADYCRKLAFDRREQVLDAAEDIAAWPERLRRHSLRPTSSLLALVLRLRLALRRAVEAAERGDDAQHILRHHAHLLRQR